MWCPLPWTHLSVKNNGTLRLCSHSQAIDGGNAILLQDSSPLFVEDIDTIDVMNCDTLKQVRKDMLDGKWPDQCGRCKIESDAGHRSRDQWETLRHIKSFNKEMAIERTEIDGTVRNAEIQDMDLRVGNQCNIRCVMCFPGETTKWYNDYKEITGEDTFAVDKKIYTLNPIDGDFNWVRSEKKVESLLRHSKNLLKINFGGGEPILIKHHKDILYGLVEEGYAPKIELEYSSNITVFPSGIFDLWKHFRLVKICASIDATSEANEAIRYGTIWNTIEDNLRMLDDSPDNIEVFTSTTISILSIEHYADTLLWLRSQGYKKINSNAHNISASHPVYNPRYLNIAILEQEQKDELLSMLYSKIEGHAELKSKLEFYEKYYDMMRISDPEQYRMQFSERFYRFATNQQQDWDRIFPFASEVARRWKR